MASTPSSGPQYPHRNDERYHAVLSHFNVDTTQRIGELSRGEWAGLNLALALAQCPRLLILDEPTLGLDVVAKRAFLEAVLDATIDDADTTIVYCSHQMDEVERLADNLIILERGKQRYMNGPDDFCACIRLWAPFPDLGAVDVARVADGTLVSVLSGYRQFEGGGAAVQRVYLFDDAGAVREVSQRALVYEFPALFEHRAWWMSAVLFSVVVLPELLIDNGDFPDAHASRLAPLVQPRLPIVWVAAITAMLLAGIGAAWWVRRVPMAPRARLLWCLACLVLGMPALLALMVTAPLPLLQRGVRRRIVALHKPQTH